jgi:pheromone a factor receptor
LVIVRLRRHRGVLSNTLSSTGSGLSARRFLKLFFLSGSILAVYLPVTLYFFYLNLDFQYVPYSWSRVHDPTVWYQIIFLTTDLSPRTQYTGWVGVGMACVLIFLYGFGSGGKEIYKRWLVSCGLGKIFPSLLESRELPMHRRGSSSRSNQASRFDLVSKAIHYYDGVRKGSHAPICSDT